jgi:hypothetical protein
VTLSRSLATLKRVTTPSLRTAVKSSLFIFSPFQTAPWVKTPSDRKLYVAQNQEKIIDWHIWRGISDDTTGNYKIILNGHVLFEVTVMQNFEEKSKIFNETLFFLFQKSYCKVISFYNLSVQSLTEDFKNHFFNTFIAIANPLNYLQK